MQNAAFPHLQRRGASLTVPFQYGAANLGLLITIINQYLP